MTEETIKTRVVMDVRSISHEPVQVSFSTTSLQSDTALTITSTMGGERYCTSLNPRNPSQKDQKKMAAEMVCPHPKKNILALKGGQVIQVYDFDMQSRMKTIKLAENVVFMKWIDIGTLAMVTDTQVYHVTMDGDSVPEPVFARLPQIAGHNIIGYRTTVDKKWCLLISSTIDPTTNKLTGGLQSYSIVKKKSQFLPGQAGTFVNAKLDGRTLPSNILCMAVGQKLIITELDTEPGVAPIQMMSDIMYRDPDDVPVAMEYSARYGFLFLVSMKGVLYAYDITTGTLCLMSQISQSPVFTTVSEDTDHGLMAVNVAGQLLHITVNPNGLIPFITQKLKNIPLATRIASRANLSGTEELFTEEFEQHFIAQRYAEAAKVAGSAPGGVLRTASIIQRFKTAMPTPGAPPPLMVYLATLMETGKLNERESLELLIPVLQQGRKELAQKWITESKVSASEELGNFLRTYDIQLALIIYLQCNAHEKVVQIYCELGEYDKVIAYSKTKQYKAPYLELIRGVCQINPAGVQPFCTLLYNNAPEGPLVDPAEVLELLFNFDLVKELSAFLMPVLSKNEASQARLQTRFLEVLLLKRPDVADALFGRQMFTEYDRSYVAHCCEKAGLYHRALEHYDALPDILRCIVFTSKMSPEFIVNYVASVSEQLDKKIGLAALKQLTKNKANLTICVEICKKCATILEPKEMIQILEEGNMVEGVYLFLQGVVTTVPDKDIVFRFIQSAVKMQQYKDVERVVRESKAYDPKQVKDFLKEAKIEPQSLIIVCDRHGYVEELIKYLYNNNQHKAIERYVTGFNTKATPVVVGALLDLEANEEFINSLLSMVQQECPISPLVEECEKRNRLRVIQSFLENRVAEARSTDPACHSALAKIYVETNNNADQFLNDNPYYDSIIVGKFCEKRDPRRAVICYRRGKCDNEMIELTNKNSLFKEQAKYLVERKDVDLWGRVLTEENTNRRALIDQVVSAALPASKDPDEVSITVKAFMNANLPNELIELLEVIMLRKSDFSNNKNLQNLLLITAIKAGSSRVRDYINRLDNYDGDEVAKFAIHHSLFEEAFEMYKKFQLHVEAIAVILDHLGDVDRAYDYAVAVNTKECWSLVARGQLAQGAVDKAIDSFLKADDPAMYHEVIEECKQNAMFAPLVKYLKMARRLKEQLIDSELIYAYARIDALAEIEEFIATSNNADIQSVGERCFDEKMYNAARILFAHIGNFGRLASALVCLGQFQAAVDAARKAQSIRTWKEVCFVCVEHQQFRLAQMCGVNIVVVADELEELVQFYVLRGHFEEIIGLLEYALHLERTHMGMFTELGILYSRFKPEKLMEHIKLFHARLNIPQLLTVCEQNLQWSELCLLYCHYDEYDSAATKMMEHIDAWVHSTFKDIIQKVSNIEIYYRAVDVYLKQHPGLLCDLLTVMAPRVDNTRVVAQMRRSGYLSLIKTYLLFVQSTVKPEIPDINEAVNDLYLEEEDVDALRASVSSYPTFDQLALARRLEKHTLLRMRRLATWLYTKNKRYAHSVSLSKKDQMYQDAMETTAVSGDATVAEELLRFFALEIDEKDRPACFAACLYACYELLSPDVVMEVAWMSDLKEYAMPFFVNATREYTTKVNTVQEELKALKEAKAQAEADAHLGETHESALANQMAASMATPGRSGTTPLPGGPSPMMMGGQMMGMGGYTTPVPPYYGGGYPGQGY